MRAPHVWSAQQRQAGITMFMQSKGASSFWLFQRAPWASRVVRARQQRSPWWQRCCDRTYYLLALLQSCLLNISQRQVEVSRWGTIFAGACTILSPWSEA